MTEPGSVAHIEAMMARKMKAGQIAKELGVSWQRATAMMMAARKRKQPTAFDLAIRERLWG